MFEYTVTGFHQRCIMYMMRRTQLYLDDQLWNALHARALSQKTTVSQLVREAIRECMASYMGNSLVRNHR